MLQDHPIYTYKHHTRRSCHMRISTIVLLNYQSVGWLGYDYVSKLTPQMIGHNHESQHTSTTS